MLSAICFNLDQSKILFSGNGLTLYSKEDSSIDSKYMQTCSLLPFTSLYSETALWFLSFSVLLQELYLSCH